MEYLKNDKKDKKAVLLSLREYESIQKELAYYKKTIEELEDKLDSIEAQTIRSESKGTLKFQLSDYVPNRNRTIGAKNIKKAAGTNSRKSRKVYS